MTHRCTKCGRENVPQDEMSATTYTRKRTGERVTVFYWCKPCKRAGVRDWEQRQREDAEAVERLREKQRRASRRSRARNIERARAQGRAYQREVQADPKARAWRNAEARRRRQEKEAANPELREARLAAQRARHAERMASDPAYRARRREIHRWSRVEQAAREGREYRPRRYRAGEPLAVEREAGGVLPSAPLADAIARFARRQTFGGRATRQEVLDRIAADSGVSEKTMRDWTEGHRPTVQLDTAERILIALDLLWLDVYDPVKYPRARELFTSEAA